MRLFHVSENPDITVFEPRLPTRTDLESDIPLVWAIDEEHLPNFLTPRDCPRVGYRAGANPSASDLDRFFTSPLQRHVLVIESGWFEIMGRTTLWLYEFDPAGFILQDRNAGYYTAQTAQIPTGKYALTDLFGELFRRGVELRITDNLWKIADALQASTLEWSLCRMKNACEREETDPFEAARLAAEQEIFGTLGIL